MKIKIKIYKFLVILGVVMSIFSFFGCLNKSKNWNIEQENKLVFSKFSQEEKQEYVKNYLYSNYNMKCDLIEIEKKPINVMSNEEDYYTVAITDDGFWFSIWITPQAEIKDTAFTYELKDNVNEFFVKKLEAVGIKCVVLDRFVFDEYSDRQWGTDDIEDMLLQEEISNNIHMFVTDKNIETETVKNILSEYSGSVYIHCYDYYNGISLEQYDYFIDLD